LYFRFTVTAGLFVCGTGSVYLHKHFGSLLTCHTRAHERALPCPKLRTRLRSRPVLQVVTPPPPSCRFKHNNRRFSSGSGRQAEAPPGRTSRLSASPLLLLGSQVSSCRASMLLLDRFLSCVFAVMLSAGAAVTLIHRRLLLLRRRYRSQTGSAVRHRG